MANYNRRRSYLHDNENSNPIGLILNESKEDLKKARKIKDQLRKNEFPWAIGGALTGGALTGTAAYQLAKRFSSKDYARAAMTLAGSLPGLFTGADIGRKLNTYLNYRNQAKSKKIKVNNFDLQEFNTGYQLANLMGKNKTTKQKYRDIQSKLDMAHTATSIPVGLAGTAINLASGGYGGWAIQVMSDFIGDGSRNARYNYLLTNKYN